MLPFSACCCSVAKSCPTLQTHGLQHTRLPCPSLSPRVYSNSCPLSRWCHPTVSSSAAPFSSSPLLPALHIRWQRYWSFSINLSNEYSGLISFKIDWFHLLAVQETLKSLLQHPSLKECIMITFNSLLAHDYLKAGFFLSGAYSISFIIELYVMNVKYF